MPAFLKIISKSEILTYLGERRKVASLIAEVPLLFTRRNVRGLIPDWVFDISY
jgi:hypothetical protein